MNLLKRTFKRNTHNLVFKLISSAGRSFNRLYENRNHDTQSNGEEWLLNRISSLNPDVFFDVGANTGKYCIGIRKYHTSAYIYCFEPVKSTFGLLKKAVGESQPITLINAGLYSETKKVSINIYPSHTHASLFDLKAVPYERMGKEEIDVIKGDDFILNNKLAKVDVLKLDIEGAELNALKGLGIALSEKKIRLIQFEYGYINITTKNLLADYYDFFTQYGYLIGKLYPKRVVFRPYQFKYEDFIGPNMIAVAKDDQKLIRLLS